MILVLLIVPIVVVLVAIYLLFVGWPGHYFFGLFFLFLLVLLVLSVVRVLLWSARRRRWAGRYRARPGGGPWDVRPEQVVRMRYARGEISQQQYEEMMRELARRPGGP